jgi:hypothetical protein
MSDDLISKSIGARGLSQFFKKLANFRTIALARRVHLLIDI